MAKVKNGVLLATHAAPLSFDPVSSSGSQMATSDKISCGMSLLVQFFRLCAKLLFHLEVGI